MDFRYFEWDERYNPNSGKSSFDTLWDLFQQLLTISSGDVNQALNWLSDLDKQYKITDKFEDGYGLGDFIEEMMERGYLENNSDDTRVVITKKTERSLRQQSASHPQAYVRHRQTHQDHLESRWNHPGRW